MEKRTKFGFTLIEVLLAVAIFVIISGVIYLFFMAGIGGWEVGTVRTDLQATARIATEFMVEELKNTTRNHATRSITILPPPNNRNIIFYLPEKNAGGEVIIDANGEIDWPDDDEDYIEYKYLAGTKQLVREDQQVREAAAPAYIIANNVSNIEFVDYSIDAALYQDELNLELSLAETTPRGRNLSFTLHSTVKLRN